MLDPTPLLPTGIHGLDEILLGGISRGNIALVEGGPGSGKTTLGLEFIYRGAVDYNEPGLVVSLEIDPAKLLRDAQGFGWDFESLRQQRRVNLIYTSPTVLLQELQSHNGVLLAEVQRLQARRVLIDGLTPLRLYAEHLDSYSYRDSLHLLVMGMQRLGATTLLTRELPSHPGTSCDFGHEEFICDTVFNLHQESCGRGRVRSLEITKSRGQDFIAGRHTLRIEAGQGVRVYRRAQSRTQDPREMRQSVSSRRTSIGVTALDSLLGGGIYEGSSTLLVGISGTGKTVLGCQFLTQGARQGAPGLLVTLDEPPAQLLRNTAGLELGLREQVQAGRVLIHYERPYELELDIHFHTLTELIERHGIRRVLIDSIAAYLVEDRQGFHEFVQALSSHLKNRLITTLFNYESPELLGVSQISEHFKASTIVDNIVLLNYVEIGNRLRRAITVPKARGSAPVRDTREYLIRRGGITLLEEPGAGEGGEETLPQLPFSAYYGILARSPSRRSPFIEERVMDGGDLPPSSQTAPSREADSDSGEGS